MIKQLTFTLVEAVKSNGPMSVFWAGVIEQVISPIPSVLIPVSGGVILIDKGLDFFPALIQILRKISIPYGIGATIGSSVLYLGSFYGGRLLIEKYGKFFGLSLRNVERFRKKFTRGFRDEILIFLLVILPATPISLVAASCGAIEIGALEFYPLLFVGTIVRATFLGWLGWQTGEVYHSLVSGLNLIETALTITGVTAGFLVLFFLYYKRQRMLKD